MKNMHYTFILALMLFSFSWAEATVIRVDNNEDASADYVKLQDAINNAESGDTIYVVGSSSFYDTNDIGQVVEIRINKKVTIIGPGFFLGANDDTQASNTTAMIEQLNIGEGADGTTITGMDFSSISNIYVNAERFDFSNGNNGPSNISFIRNAISNIEIVDATNTLISQNYFQPPGTSNAITLRVNASGTIIRNNILSDVGNSAAIIGPLGETLSNTVIENNTINKGISRVNGVIILNNIFINGIFTDSNNNTVSNNLFTTTQDAVFPSSSTGNGISNNIYSAIVSDIFVVPNPSVDNEFRLAEDSPAVGQGVNGVDLGAFGGPAPYRLSGVPSIPAIYELSTNGVGTPSDGMKVQIKAKANN